MGISVIVPTRDKAGSLRATLACLAVEPVVVDRDLVEVVIVDDGADRRGSAATEEVVARFADRLAARLVIGPCRGRAAARNAGASTAAQDRLLFLDDDILTAPGFLPAHLAHVGSPSFVHGPLWEFPGARRWLAAQAGIGDDQLAAAAADVVCGRCPEVRLFRNALERAILAVDAGTVTPMVKWLAAVGANLAVQRSVFHDIGGFDEGFGTGWGCEDLELGVRLLNTGHQPLVEHGACGVHLTHARPNRWAEHDANLARFSARHDLESVRALPELLGERGSLARYLARL